MYGRKKGRPHHYDLPRHGDMDISVLQKPILISQTLTGVQQITETLRVGTEEVRKVLNYECDVIFECKLCRNLFRSIANFLAHKRAYCMKHVSEGHNTEEEELVILKPELKDSDPVDFILPDFSGEFNHDVELIERVDGLQEKETKAVQKTIPTNVPAINTLPQKEKSIHKKSLNEKLLELRKKQAEKLGQPTTELQLKSIKTTSNAVVQKRNRGRPRKDDSPKSVSHITPTTLVIEPMQPRPVGRPRKNETMRVESKVSIPLVSNDQNRMNTEQHTFTTGTSHTSGTGDENIHRSLRERAGGEVATPTAVKLSARNDCDIKSKRCLKCKTSYTSLKTLAFHMQSFHSEKRRFYPCLFCKATFVQLWGVQKHMKRIHNKNNDQVKRLAESIRRKSFVRPIESTAPSKVVAERKIQPETQVTTSMPLTQTTVQIKEEEKPVSKIRRSSVVTEEDLKCEHCMKQFFKKESLERHLTFCFDGRESDEKPNFEAENDLEQSRWLMKITKKDVKRIQELIDEKELTCLKCHLSYSCVSNLHRHAVRHLGWKRFKCHFCPFTSYNKSECKTHLRKVHHTEVKGQMNLNASIIDLHVKDITNESDSVYGDTESSENEEVHQVVQNGHDNVLNRSFNISTRNSPRHFDTSPYKREEGQTDLGVKSGTKRKLTEELVESVTKSVKIENGVVLGSNRRMNEGRSKTSTSDNNNSIGNHVRRISRSASRSESGTAESPRAINRKNIFDQMFTGDKPVNVTQTNKPIEEDESTKVLVIVVEEQSHTSEEPPVLTPVSVDTSSTVTESSVQSAAEDNLESSDPPTLLVEKARK